MRRVPMGARRGFVSPLVFSPVRARTTAARVRAILLVEATSSKAIWSVGVLAASQRAAWLARARLSMSERHCRARSRASSGTSTSSAVRKSESAEAATLLFAAQVATRFRASAATWRTSRAQRLCWTASARASISADESRPLCATSCARASHSCATKFASLAPSTSPAAANETAAAVAASERRSISKRRVPHSAISKRASAARRPNRGSGGSADAKSPRRTRHRGAKASRT
mmetsp:Transcript_29794/g.91221  ORF Transcript_29794/g.91221 Transcript_29794/m.91221 type:complete len:231 (-) Transcript_29794:517-1209(-)